jgi:hypothetical protein
MEKYEDLKQLAVNYLYARHTFISESSKFEELTGNDNLIGRIGELIALEFLHRQGRSATKNKNLVEKGYDLLTSDNQMISVKLITAENKKGRTTRFKKPWTEIVLITLNSNYKVDRLGHITDNEFEKALTENFIKDKELYSDRKLLSDNGLFEKYGKLYKEKDVLDYL